MKITDFIDNLTKDDVDLIDKLDNLNGHEQISEEDYELASEETNFKDIEEFVIEILQNGDDLSDQYINFIVNETQRLYEEDLCRKDDFTAGYITVMIYICSQLKIYYMEMIILYKEINLMDN